MEAGGEVYSLLEMLLGKLLLFCERTDVVASAPLSLTPIVLPLTLNMDMTSGAAVQVSCYLRVVFRFVLVLSL